MPSLSRSKLPSGPPTRWKSPLPPERVNEMAFVWDGNGRIIAPWVKHAPLWQDEEAALRAVIQQLEQFGPALRRPFWLHPDGRAPTPINASDPRWLARWSRDRACRGDRPAGTRQSGEEYLLLRLGLLLRPARTKAGRNPSPVDFFGTRNPRRRSSSTDRRLVGGVCPAGGSLSASFGRLSVISQLHFVKVCHPCCQDRQCCCSPCGPLASK